MSAVPLEDREWNKWKRESCDGRASMELRERSLWQSALNLKAFPPPITDIHSLAKMVRAGYTT